MPLPMSVCERLRQADEAYNELLRGGQVKSITDENGENIQYTGARTADLLAYIRVLQSQCVTYKAMALGGDTGPRAPFRFVF